MSKTQFKVFVDMDGVLCDFSGGAISVMNETIIQVFNRKNFYKTQKSEIYKAVKKAVSEMGGDLDNDNSIRAVIPEDIVRENGKRKIRNLMYTLVANDYKFWANLEWMPEAQKLWEYVRKHNPIILSGPQGPNSKLGKKDWCIRELGWGKDKIILTQTKHDVIREVQEEGKMALLIDDLPKYVVPFRNAGGIAIQHVDIQTTIDQLKEFGL